MGVKFRTSTQFREACTFTFWIHIIFLVLSEPLYLLALHNIFDFTTYAHRSVRHDIFSSSAMPIFCCTTLFLISPRMLIVRCASILLFYRDAIFLKRHDIYGFTPMPFFCRFTILLYFHELLLISKR